MKSRKKIWIILAAGMLAAAFIISPFFQFIKALAVMSVYSASEKQKSFLTNKGIEIEMKGGWSTPEKDWFPFVMTFNDSAGFSAYIGEAVELSILYNFAAYDYMQGASHYYNRESRYFNAFYGAYALQPGTGKFGLKADGGVDFEALAVIPRYDMNELVLKSIGCAEPVFEFDIQERFAPAEFLGESGWQAIDAVITTQSPMHDYQQDYMAYIQYGRPPQAWTATEDFETVQVRGRVYAKYNPEQDVVMCFYVIAPDQEVIEETDRRFLQSAEIHW